MFKNNLKKSHLFRFLNETFFTTFSSIVESLTIEEEPFSASLIIRALSFFWTNEHLGPLVQYVIKWPPLPLLCAWLLLAAKFLSASLIHDSSAIIAHSLPDAKKMANAVDAHENDHIYHKFPLFIG